MRRPFLFLLVLLGLLPLAPAFADGPQGYGVLIISRERLEVGTPCEIGLYMQDQLVGRLFPEQTVSYNLPPGPLVVRLQILPGNAPGCNPGIVGDQRSTTLTLQAGDIRKYRIATGPEGLFLKAAPLDYAP
ncbi:MULTISPECIES: hypothetical protein [Pseudomonas]|uniref:hypothetical protein n=1 Tax=Pseudomonas TaxID=286 RepID=UPI0015E2F856|nr:MULTISPECIES: hypothetical protein [Pseudomonas]MBA1245614.1 hypothetical protein [Pseudomonas japonica]MBA1289794.1 hypothetical protein [Pseudomonas japonica]